MGGMRTVPAAPDADQLEPILDRERWRVEKTLSLRELCMRELSHVDHAARSAEAEQADPEGVPARTARRRVRTVACHCHRGASRSFIAGNALSGVRSRLGICRRPHIRAQNCTGALIRHSDRAICPKARGYCPLLPYHWRPCRQSRPHEDE